VLTGVFGTALLQTLCLKTKVIEQTGKFPATGTLFTFWTNG
jgi:hypothetical protein